MPPFHVKRADSELSAPVAAALARLGARYELARAAITSLAALLAALAEPDAPTAVHDPAAGVDIHIADALVGLEIAALRRARAIADLGAGAGVPGLVLAIALPGAQVALVETTERKCEFLRATVAALGLSNVDVVASRAETWVDGRERCDVVVARALASLSVLCEYAAPLLVGGGSLIAWKGAVQAAEAADGIAAADQLGLRFDAPRTVTPFARSERRTLWVAQKVAPTPPNYPRRPGIAKKRPLTAKTSQ